MDNVKRLSTQWGLSDLHAVPNITHHHVLSGFQGERPVILKLGRDIDALAHEAMILDAFKGFGAVQVIRSEPGALLLERAVPGLSLRSYFPDKETEAINIVCTLMEKLHQAPIPSSNTLLHVNDWLQALDQAWDIPENLLQQARKMRDTLLASAEPPVLLHGDLHHDNILEAGESWVVIDPKGVIGERAYEVAAFIRNPIPELLSASDPQEIIKHRIAAFASRASLDPIRIRDWCFVQAVLCWTWAIEDGVEVGYFRELTQLSTGC